MYTSDRCMGEDAILHAHTTFENLKNMDPEAKAFITYFDQMWMKKIKMWVTR